MPCDYLCNFILCICFTLYCTVIVAIINSIYISHSGGFVIRNWLIDIGRPNATMIIRTPHLHDTR